MTELISDIVHKVESLQANAVWQSKDFNTCPNFARFTQEWCSHLNLRKAEVASELNKASLTQDQRSDLVKKYAAPSLFQIGEAKFWSSTLEELENVSGHESTLKVCQSVSENCEATLRKHPDLIKEIFTSKNEGQFYQRKILAVLPYAEGVLSCVLIRFPKQSYALPHTHPNCFFETIIDGEITEISFAKNEDKKYEIKDLKTHISGDKIKTYCSEGSPHMILSPGQDSTFLAVFSGPKPMKYIPANEISHPDELLQITKRLSPQKTGPISKYLNI